MTAWYLRQQIQQEQSFLSLMGISLLDSAHNVSHHFDQVKQLVVHTVTGFDTPQLIQHGGKLITQRLEKLWDCPAPSHPCG